MLGWRFRQTAGPRSPSTPGARDTHSAALLALATKGRRREPAGRCGRGVYFQEQNREARAETPGTLRGSVTMAVIPILHLHRPLHRPGVASSLKRPRGCGRKAGRQARGSRREAARGAARGGTCGRQASGLGASRASALARGVRAREEPGRGRSPAPSLPRRGWEPPGPQTSGAAGSSDPATWVRTREPSPTSRAREGKGGGVRRDVLRAPLTRSRRTRK